MVRVRTRPAIKTITVTAERKIPQLEKICPICGTIFMGAKVAVYDTVACRQKANYQRNKELYSKAKAEKYQREKAAKSETVKPVNKRQA